MSHPNFWSLKKISTVSAIALSIGVIFLMMVVRLLGVWLFTPLLYPLATGTGTDIITEMALRLRLGGSDGVIVGIYTAFTAIVMSAIVWLMAWGLCGEFSGIRRLLGLSVFGAKIKVVVVSVALLVMLNVVGGVIGEILQKDTTAFMSELITPQSLPILFVAVVIAAPIYEELMFRGLILGAFANAWQNHRYGVIFACIISSILFSLIHLQYDWYGATLIFLMALVFAYARIYGSLMLAMLLHLLNNLYAMLVLLLG